MGLSVPHDEGNGGPDFNPAYGIHLHDPRLLEYVGAPESARLLSRSPEYWLHHMGREKTLSAVNSLVLNVRRVILDTRKCIRGLIGDFVDCGACFRRPHGISGTWR